MERNITVGSILSEAMAVVSASRQDFALFTGVIGVLTAIGVVAGLTETSTSTISMGFSLEAGKPLGNGLFDLLVSVATAVGGYMLVKRMLGARGLLHTSGNLFWPYVGMSILTVLGAILGLILLVVPGIIVLVRWSAAAGYLIGAGQSVTDSMSASWRATSGHSWPIFFASIVLFLGLVIAIGVVVGVFIAINATLGGVVSAFLEAAISAVFAAFGVAVYAQVANDTQQLSETFG
jgi:hypothetical protein